MDPGNIYSPDYTLEASFNTAASYKFGKSERNMAHVHKDRSSSPSPDSYNMQSK